MKESTVDIFGDFIDSRLAEIHTSMPGKILAYNPITEIATVQPLVKLTRKVGEEIISLEIPPIENVPVMFLHTMGFYLKFPIKPGDGCEIKFSEVGIGNFLNGSMTIVEPEDLARFSLTDAYCTPGLWSKSGRPTNLPTIEFTDAGLLNFLTGTEPFTKGATLEAQLTSLLTAISVAGHTAVDAATVITAVQGIATACDVAIPLLPAIKSLKIKGE